MRIAASNSRDVHEYVSVCFTDTYRVYMLNIWVNMLSHVVTFEMLCAPGIEFEPDIARDDAARALEKRLLAEYPCIILLYSLASKSTLDI